MIPERRAQPPFYYPHPAPRCPSKVRSRSAHVYSVSPSGDVARDACQVGVEESQGSVSPGRRPGRGRQPLGAPTPPCDDAASAVTRFAAFIFQD